MTTEAFGIVGVSIANQKFVGVVTTDARDACVAFTPAAALLEPIRGKANRSWASQSGEVYVPTRSVTRATKVDGIYRGQRVQADDETSGLVKTATAGGNMSSSRTVTLFASNAGSRMRGIKNTVCGCGCEVASKAFGRLFI